ncbi:MAG: amidase family protein, partial [Hyphomonadaceae bacterium]
MDEIFYRSATQMLADLAAKRISARELLEAHAARNEALHAELNMIIATDLDRARQDAHVIDDQRAKGAPLDALAGLPMTIKDGFDVEGLPAVAGNPAYKMREARCADAVLAARARAAGAVLWGKSNVPYMLGDFQTYNPVYGATNNPYDVTRTPAGSSGGAAAALAAGVTPLEIGSDIGGSLRHPANFCGVHALKTTWGQLPTRGHAPPGPDHYIPIDLAVMGPMARTARDVRLLQGVLRGAPSASPRPIKGRRVAVWLEEPGFKVGEDARAAVMRAGEALSHHGAEVRAAKPSIDGGALLDAYFGLLNPIMAAGFPKAMLARFEAQRGEDEAAVRAGADRYSAPAARLQYGARYHEVAAHMAAREALKDRLAAFFEEGWDAILTPISPVAAFPHNQKEGYFERTLLCDGAPIAYPLMLDWIALATALHAPALAAPAGQTGEGLPIGVQLVGRWNEVDSLLDV